MKGEQEYQYPVEIGISMMNENEALTPGAYQQLAMQVIEQHLFNIEMDEQRLIEQYSVAWVLMSMSFELRRRIQPRERLYARTWNSGGSRLLFRRDLVFYDEQDEIVLTCATFSTLLDLTKRRVCTDPEMLQRFALPAGEQLMQASDRLRLKVPALDPVETLTVRPSWIDGVGHVNNCRYGEFVYDALTDAQRAQMANLKRLELYFVNETKLGEQLVLHRIDEPQSAIVTATHPGAMRPSFAGKVVFG